MWRERGRLCARRSACATARANCSQVEIGSYPHGGVAEADEALAAAVAAYDNGRGEWPTMTVAERIACMQDFTKKMVAARGEVVQLLMWEIGKSLRRLREGVRPHGRLHPGHDRGAEGARQQQLPLRRRRGHDRPDPAHAARRGPVHGPVQLPAERDLRDADPGPDHGQHAWCSSRRTSACCCSRRCWRRSATPSRKGVINTVYGEGAVVVPLLLGSGKVNVLTLIGSSKVADHLKKLHPKVAPPARDPRASTPRTRRSSCRTPISSSPSRNACSARCRSTASAAPP